MFTELIKEVLIPFSATQNANTNQISNKESQEKSEFLGDKSLWKIINIFCALYCISFTSSFQVSKNHQPNTRHVCKKLLH